MFNRVFAVRKEIKRRQNALQKRVKAQKESLMDIIPFQALMQQIIKIISMLFDKEDTLESVIVETDPLSETMVNQFIDTQLQDFIVKMIIFSFYLKIYQLKLKFQILLSIFLKNFLF